LVYDIENAQHFLQTKNCGGRKMHKGQSPTAFFWNPSRPNGRRSSYCLLGDVKSAFISSNHILQLIFNYFSL